MPGLRTSGSEVISFSRRLLRNLRSRGLLTAVFLALALWLYVSLNNSYSIQLTLPLQVKTNDNQAIENSLPSKLTVIVKGKGWDLINARYIGTSGLCLLDISRYDLETETIDFPYTKLANGIRSMENFEIRSITPENITIQLGKISNNTKPIKSNIVVNPRIGFTLVGDIKFEPSEVLVKGFASKLNSLENVPTNNLNIEDAYSNLSGTIGIADTLFNFFKISPKSLKYTAKIQMKCDLAFHQIPVKVRGGALSSSNLLQPKFITVYLTGGVEELSKITPDDIEAFVDYDNVLNDTTGNLVPEIIVPNNVSLLKTVPSYLYHYQYSNSSLY